MSGWRFITLGSNAIRRLGVGLFGLATMVKFGTTTGMALSMLLSLAVYALAFGWRFAVGFLLLLFVHEVGHLVAVNVVGLKASRPMFVPFLGAVISLRRPPVNAKMEANIAIAGPAAGTLSALVCMAIYLWTDSTLMLVLCYTACLLNLFNLIPCDPLDGGKIASAISPRLWWVGSICTGILYFYTHNFFVFVILLVSLFRIWRGDRDECGKSYYCLSLRQRLNVTWWYFGLLVVLGVMTLFVVELL